jgi:hypothetical protein
MGLLKDWNKELPFPAPQSTGAPIRDKLFNWILGRYEKFHHPWTKSDDLIWRAVINVMGELIGILFFFWIMWLLINFSLKKYGEVRTIIYVILLLIFRINIMIQQINKLNKKFY